MKKIFGERLRTLRRQKNFTQEQMAEMINIQPENYSRIENGLTCIAVWEATGDMYRESIRHLMLRLPNFFNFQTLIIMNRHSKKLSLNSKMTNRQPS